MKRRRWPRWPMTYSVLATTPAKQPASALPIDGSGGGLCVCMDDPPPVNTSVRADITPEGAEPLTVTGRVRWVTRDASRDTWLVGIELE